MKVPFGVLNNEDFFSENIRQGRGIQNNVPHVLILGVCEYARLHDNGNFADVIKLSNMEWGDYPGLSK